MIRQPRFEIDGIDEDPDVVGDPEDESITDITGVAPPCEACGRREADEEVGGTDLCRECIDGFDGDRRLLDFLDWLQPTARGDFVATEIGPQSRRARAAERDVLASSISSSVSRAYDRLTEIAEEQGHE